MPLTKAFVGAKTPRRKAIKLGAIEIDVNWNFYTRLNWVAQFQNMKDCAFSLQNNKIIDILRKKFQENKKIMWNNFHIPLTNKQSYAYNKSTKNWKTNCQCSQALWFSPLNIFLQSKYPECGRSGYLFISFYFCLYLSTVYIFTVVLRVQKSIFRCLASQGTDRWWICRTRRRRGIARPLRCTTLS